MKSNHLAIFAIFVQCIDDVKVELTETPRSRVFGDWLLAQKKTEKNEGGFITVNACWRGLAGPILWPRLRRRRDRRQDSLIDIVETLVSHHQKGKQNHSRIDLIPNQADPSVISIRTHQSILSLDA